MAEETTEAAPEDSAPSTPDVPEGIDSPVETSSNGEEAATAAALPPETTPEPAATVATSEVTSEVEEGPATPNEPDAIQPFINKAFETIQHEVESAELDKFLRGHIKTFREEWDIWPDTAKDAYVHMMTSQLLQRKAARTRIMNYEEFKLPVPSAQTTLFESIKQSQIKPKKCTPVLLMPPNLRPTYAYKK